MHWESLIFITLAVYVGWLLRGCVSFKQSKKQITDNTEPAVQLWTFNRYQQAVIKTASFNDEVYALYYTTLSLTGEAGEVANKVKKLLRGDCTVEQAKAGIILEIGDVLWSCAYLADLLEVALDEAADANIQKIKARIKTGTIKGNGDDR